MCGHDFMRQSLGKLSFADTMRLVLTMGKGTSSPEMIRFFNMNADRIPSQSAFIQRRNQISLATFRYLFDEFSLLLPHRRHTCSKSTASLRLTAVMSFMHGKNLQ